MLNGFTFECKTKMFAAQLINGYINYDFISW